MRTEHPTPDLNDVPVVFRHRGQVMPAILQGSLTLYAKKGIPTGDFLRAVLSNDLMEAMARADDRNEPLLPVICAFVYNCLPRGCHGSPEAVKNWIENHPYRKETADDD